MTMIALMSRISSAGPLMKEWMDLPEVKDSRYLLRQLTVEEIRESTVFSFFFKIIILFFENLLHKDNRKEHIRRWIGFAV